MEMLVRAPWCRIATGWPEPTLRFSLWQQSERQFGHMLYARSRLQSAAKMSRGVRIAKPTRDGELENLANALLRTPTDIQSPPFFNIADHA